MPAYTTNTVADHLHVLDDSGARAFIVSTPNWPRAAGSRPRGARDTAAGHRHRGPAPAQHTGRPDVLPGPRPCWHRTRTAAAIPGAAQALEPDDTWRPSSTPAVPAARPRGSCCRIATSCRTAGAYHLLEGLAWSARVPVLPAAVAFLRTHRRAAFPSFPSAPRYWFARGHRASGHRTCRRCEPTIMTAVPRLYETMRTRILRGLESQPESKPQAVPQDGRAGPQALSRPQVAEPVRAGAGTPCWTGWSGARWPRASAAG